MDKRYKQPEGDAKIAPFTGPHVWWRDPWNDDYYPTEKAWVCHYCGQQASAPEGQRPKLDEPCKKSQCPWSHHDINRSYIFHLWEKFGLRRFSNKEAYAVYAHQHAEGPQDQWTDMNARNHLSAAAYRDILHRIGPGLYCFTDVPPDYEEVKANL